MKGNKFWFFALFSMLVVFSAVPTWADSWVSVGGNTYYYNNASVADSGTGYIAAESAELDENGFYNITADQLNTMSKEEKASMEKIKLDSSFSNIINDSVSLVNLLNDFTGVTTLDISEINFKADASDNSGSTTPTVTLDLTQLPAHVKTLTMANNSTVTDVVINYTLEEFSAPGCSHLKSFKLSDAGEVSLAATPALKKLYLTGTEITELDLSLCANLETLIIADCGLDGSKLNIGGLTKLTEIDISGNKFLKFNAPLSVTNLTCNSQTVDIDVAPSASLNMSDILNASLVTLDDSAALAATDSDCANVSVTGAWNGSEAVTVLSYSKETGELLLDGVADKLAYDYNTGSASMDVTATLSGSDNVIGGSSSGCNLNVAALGLVMVLSFFLRTKILR